MTAARKRRRKSAEVVCFGGGNILPSPRNPDEDVIRHLEWMLERARAGEITQATTAYSYADGATGWCSKGSNKPALRRAMIGALADAQFCLLRAGEDD